MKKLLLLSVLTASILSSCSSENEDPNIYSDQNAISIDAFAPKMQKGADATTNSLASGINIYAYKSGAPYTTTPFLNNILFEKKDQYWVSTPLTYYWPSYPLDFYGFYPKDVKPSDVAEPTKFSYTVNPDAAKESDVVVSTIANQTREVVQMQYHHALSKVSFIITSAASSGLNVSVNSIAVTDIPMNGNFELNKTATAVPDFFTVSGQSGNNTATVTPATPVVVKSAATNVSSSPVSGLFLMPHTLVNWKYSDTNAFPMKGSYININGSLTGVTDYSGNIAIPITTTEWQPGYHYTYNIVFGNAGGTTGGGGYNPDKGTDGGKKPEQILMPIQVNVTVDQWVDVTPSPDIDL
ncbi:MAG: fimbrillin family protein [Bacteroidales bacterium]